VPNLIGEQERKEGTLAETQMIFSFGKINNP
jgi:hypothetical protein